MGRYMHIQVQGAPFLHQKVHAHSSSSRTKYCTQNKEQSRRRIGSRITSLQIDEANGLVGTDAIVGGVLRRFQFKQKKKTKKKQKKKTNQKKKKKLKKLKTKKKKKRRK